jgi:hypothetical protein
VQLSLKILLREIIAEALFGKKFHIHMTKNGSTSTLLSIASANTKPGERPYRITWFRPDLSENRHIDLELEEMQEILRIKEFPPAIIDRLKKKWSESDLVGDKFTLGPSSQA